MEGRANGAVGAASANRRRRRVPGREVRPAEDPQRTAACGTGVGIPSVNTWPITQRTDTD